MWRSDRRPWPYCTSTHDPGWLAMERGSGRPISSELVRRCREQRAGRGDGGTAFVALLDEGQVQSLLQSLRQRPDAMSGRVTRMEFLKVPPRSDLNSVASAFAADPGPARHDPSRSLLSICAHARKALLSVPRTRQQAFITAVTMLHRGEVSGRGAVLCISELHLALCQATARRRCRDRRRRLHCGAPWSVEQALALLTSPVPNVAGSPCRGVP